MTKNIFLFIFPQEHFHFFFHVSKNGRNKQQKKTTLYYLFIVLIFTQLIYYWYALSDNYTIDPKMYKEYKKKPVKKISKK